MTNYSRNIFFCRTAAWFAVFLALSVSATQAEDWPEFRGKGRLGVWNESGILEHFPEDGLEVVWRTPIKNGYAGPAVVDGRVFVTDFSRTSGMGGIERIVCLDEQTGRELWTHEWEANYAGISWDEGPLEPSEKLRNGTKHLSSRVLLIVLVLGATD